MELDSDIDFSQSKKIGAIIMLINLNHRNRPIDFGYNYERHIKDIYTFLKILRSTT